MGFFDKIKDYLSFDEDDDDSLYEAEMRELERKERAKSRRQVKEVEEDDDYTEERASSRRSSRTSSVSERRTSDSGKTAGQLAQERRRSSSTGRRTTYESSRSTPPRSPEGSYTPRNNRVSSRRSNPESGNIVSMKRESSDISIIKVQSFSDAQEVCDNLIDGKPIIVSFDDPRSSEAQRIMDFIAGCIYVINGNLHTISDSIFLFSPNGVDVSGDYLNMVQNNGFGIPTFNKMF